MLTLEKQNHLRDRFRDKVPGWRPATEQFAGLVGLYLQEGHQLLDLGCGRGGLVEQLHHPVERTVGMDPDMASLRDHRLQIQRAAGLSNRLPFSSNQFDMIYCSWLLEHLVTPEADLAEIRRVLAPGGRFVFVTPNVNSPIALLNRVLGRAKPVQNRLIERLYGREAEDAFPTYYRANSEQALTSLLDKVNRLDGDMLLMESLYYVEDPTYLAFHNALFPFLAAVEKRLPRQRRPHLVGVMRKEGPNMTIRKKKKS